MRDVTVACRELKVKVKVRAKITRPGHVDQQGRVVVGVHGHMVGRSDLDRGKFVF